MSQPQSALLGLREQPEPGTAISSRPKTKCAQRNCQGRAEVPLWLAGGGEGSSCGCCSACFTAFSEGWRPCRAAHSSFLRWKNQSRTWAARAESRACHGVWKRRLLRRTARGCGHRPSWPSVATLPTTPQFCSLLSTHQSAHLPPVQPVQHPKALDHLIVGSVGLGKHELQGFQRLSTHPFGLGSQPLAAVTAPGFAARLCSVGVGQAWACSTAVQTVLPAWSEPRGRPAAKECTALAHPCLLPKPSPLQLPLQECRTQMHSRYLPSQGHRSACALLESHAQREGWTAGRQGLLPQMACATTKV